MRHRCKTKKLGRPKQQRDALLRNLAIALLSNHSIKTTCKKAKAARGLVERVVTLSKKGDLHSRRLAHSLIGDSNTIKKLWDELSPVYKDRNGGYTRILRLGKRKGDSADMCIFELVDLEKVMKRKPKEEK